MRKHTKEDEDFIRDNLRYDPETGHLWWIKDSKHRLGKRNLDKPVGSINKHLGYVLLSLYLTSGQVHFRAHRIAWFLHYGSWPKDMLDHVNGIRTDNRIENLREATQNQNDMNKKKKDDCSSKYKGVSWNKKQQRWLSYISVNKQQTHLGVYTSEKEAARAYDKVAREHFGEYARLNFPEEHEQGALNGHDV